MAIYESYILLIAAESSMPLATLDTIVIIGFPGISRGSEKLRNIAINKVKRYQADFFSRYF